MKDHSPKRYIFLVLIIFLIIGAVIFALIVLRTDSVDERKQKDQLINILFTVAENEKLVLLELYLYNPQTSKGVILSLPPSMWLMLESLDRYDKIEKLYVRGNPRRLIEKIERIIDIKIPYYIEIEGAGLVSLVDLLGGVELFVPATVQKREAGKRFLFESGRVVLDGDKARDFLSLELADDTDMERAQRKQDFIKALLDGMIENAKTGFLLKSEALYFFMNSVSTNLSSQELETLLVELEKLNIDAVLYRRAHGTTRVQNGEQIFIPNDQGDQLKQTMRKAVDFLRDSEKLRPEDMIVTLEILNGTDIAFRARDTAKIYKKYGYEVAKEDNAPEKPLEKTVIIDRKGNPKLAQEVAAIIKCKNIRTEISANSQIDITILIGKDFNGKYCQNE